MASFDPDPVPFDVVFNLDSCYSGAATRNTHQQIQGVIEVLAAVADDQTAFGNNALNPWIRNHDMTGIPPQAINAVQPVPDQAIPDIVTPPIGSDEGLGWNASRDLPPPQPT
ncbi:hypothetical protein FQN53_000685 [Emmonsiellopsis sp. PD_33]|nr:hypothetical protein FQN53_000685 [Emmonsiellopsis sp. PD_33]